MRIGILTFHRAHNYGAVLQCYALQEVLKKRGHEVQVINYVQDHIEKIYKVNFFSKEILHYILSFKYKKLYQHISSYKHYIKSKKSFKHFVLNSLSCTPECTKDCIPQNFDAYVVGSDQVWSIQCTHGFDSVFWGKFARPSDSILIGFSISSNGDYEGVVPISMIKESLREFNSISFRELSTKNKMDQIMGCNYKLTLDPTLLAESLIWEPLINKEWADRKYVAIYEVRRSENWKSMLIDKARCYANNNGCEIIRIIPGSYSVNDFLSILRYADCVFTSSFHATVFSVILNAPFYSFILEDGHDERYVSLLNKLGLENHIANKDTEALLPCRIANYNNMKEKLTSLKTQSLEYLDFAGI